MTLQDKLKLLSSSSTLPMQDLITVLGLLCKCWVKIMLGNKQLG